MLNMTLTHTHFAQRKILDRKLIQSVFKAMRLKNFKKYHLRVYYDKPISEPKIGVSFPIFNGICFINFNIITIFTISKHFLSVFLQFFSSWIRIQEEN